MEPHETHRSPGVSPRESALARQRDRADSGMATAEYAIATLAACGFAALLVVILRSDTVRDLLMGIIEHALSLGS